MVCVYAHRVTRAGELYSLMLINTGLTIIMFNSLITTFSSVWEWSWSFYATGYRKLSNVESSSLDQTRSSGEQYPQGVQPDSPALSRANKEKRSDHASHLPGEHR